MKFLIITQKVDVNDPILGFFHRWLEEFAKHYESLTVICLQQGYYNLPKNVKVLSLGKEKGESRTKYVLNFYKDIWSERRNYDSVFVHMNQEYVLLGGLFWKFLGKKIFLWRNHAKGNFLTRLAVLLSDKVFCTSPQSFTARFRKTKLMPVGIDTDFFRPKPEANKIPNSILFLGRIAPVKNVDLFVATLCELQRLGVQFTATIAGSALPIDVSYEKEIKDKVAKSSLVENVQFVGAVSQIEARRLYQEHELYVNLTPSGSMDKTIFEAMACGLVVVSSNRALDDVSKINDNLLCREIDIFDIKEKLLNLLQLSRESKTLIGEKLRQYVIEQHSLKMLIERVLRN